MAIGGRRLPGVVLAPVKLTNYSRRRKANRQRLNGRPIL